MGYSVLSRYRSALMGAAMLWVMLFHARDLDLGLEGLNLLRAAGFGGVDIFILLSAMGLAVSLGRRERKYGTFLARRAGRVLPAYYAVMLPYTAWKIARGAAPLSTLFWNASLLSYWARAEGSFNWYVSGIMTFYVLTPPAWALLRRSRRPAALTAAAVAAGLLLCRYILQGGAPWAWLDFFYRVPVFFLGLLMGRYVLEERKLGRADKAFWALWLALGAGYLALSFLIDPDVLYLPLCHLFLFTTVPMCLTGCLLFERLPLGALRRLLRLVGENSLEIYLLNVSVFSETALLHGLVRFGPTNRLFYCVMFTVNIALGVLLHRCVERARECWRKYRYGKDQTSAGPL